MPTETYGNFATYPPSTFDRADGSEGQPGTPDTDESYKINPSCPGQCNTNRTFFEEEPDSPEIERGEQGTILHKFRCDPETAKVIISTIGRGYTLTDTNGNTSRVVTSRMTYNRGLVCGIHIAAETLNWDWPIDEFSLEVTELNPAIEKHPRYNLLTYKDRINVHGAVQAEGIEYKGMYDSIIQSINSDAGAPISDKDVLRYKQARELAFKLHKAEDSFYLPGFRITYSQYFSSPVFLNPGGYIQDPVESGVLPFYFWSTKGDNDPEYSMFAGLSAINPIIYPAPSNTSISWLRLCDTLSYQRTWFKVTSTWQGGPLGQWDKELYTILFNAPGNTPAYGMPYQTEETDGTVLRPS